MLATVINVVLVLTGSAVGLLFKNLISDKLTAALTRALGLCTVGIGVSSLIGTRDMLCVIVCMVTGTAIGHAVDLERRFEGTGDFLKAKLVKGDSNSRFTEGLVTAFLLYCVGAMSITGSIEAGLNHNYKIIISKGVMDGVSSVSFAATMGIGVAFSAVPMLLYQGGITLLAGWVGPYLPEAVIIEMSAVGGALIVGIGVNLLELGREKIKVGNMLPAILLPIAYIPLAEWLSGSLPFS